MSRTGSSSAAISARQVRADAGHLEQASHRVRDRAEGEGPLALLAELVGLDQGSETGRIDETAPAQVELEATITVQRVLDRFIQQRSAVRIQFADDADDRTALVLVLANEDDADALGLAAPALVLHISPDG